MASLTSIGQHSIQGSKAKSRGRIAGTRLVWCIFVKGNDPNWEVQPGWLVEQVKYKVPAGFINYVLKVSKGSTPTSKVEASLCLAKGQVHLVRTEAEAAVWVKQAIAGKA